MRSGLILTLVCVCVVFGALLILYFVYSLIGMACNGKFRIRKKKGDEPTDDEVAAMAIALDLYLHEEQAKKDEGIHDYESGMITIKR